MSSKLFYDSDGFPAGRQDESGQIYDRDGNITGRVDSVGQIYNGDGVIVGRRDDAGYITDGLAPKGRVDDDGYYHNRDGFITGREEIIGGDIPSRNYDSSSTTGYGGGSGYSSKSSSENSPLFWVLLFLYFAFIMFGVMLSEHNLTYGMSCIQQSAPESPPSRGRGC